MMIDSSAVLSSNDRGIPKAPFASTAAEYINGKTAEQTLLTFNETLATYKRLQESCLNRLRSLKSKIPELTKALQMVNELIENRDSDEPMNVHVEINDTMYVKAKVAKTEKICLWLGANVMVEYTLDEAKKLLTEKLEKATNSQKVVAEDVDFLREQITTMEVNIARVYNFNIKQNKKK